MAGRLVRLAQDDLHEKLRDDWALAATLEERKAVARSCRRMPGATCDGAAGPMAPPVARRANVSGFIPIPAHVPSGTSRRLEIPPAVGRSIAGLGLREVGSARHGRLR